MNLGWKVIIPVALAWVMVVATVRALRNEGYESRWLAGVSAAQWWPSAAGGALPQAPRHPRR